MAFQILSILLHFQTQLRYTQHDITFHKTSNTPEHAHTPSKADDTKNLGHNSPAKWSWPATQQAAAILDLTERYGWLSFQFSHYFLNIHAMLRRLLLECNI